MNATATDERTRLVLAGETDAGAPACAKCASVVPELGWYEAGARCVRCGVPLEVAEAVQACRGGIAL